MLSFDLLRAHISRDCFTDGNKPNDASLKLVVIYFCSTFFQTLKFYGLSHSARIFKGCEHCVDRKQTIDFLRSATLCSRTASPAKCVFFDCFTCIRIADVVLVYEFRYVVW